MSLFGLPTLFEVPLSTEAAPLLTHLLCPKFTAQALLIYFFYLLINAPSVPITALSSVLIVALSHTSMSKLPHLIIPTGHYPFLNERSSLFLN